MTVAETALVALYERYAPALLRKGERMLQHRQDTEDLVHALFVDLLRKKKTGVDLPYLYRAMTNRCINHLRSQKTRRRLLSEHDSALRGPQRTRLDEQVVHLDLLVKLAAHLDDKHYEVIVYRYIDDMQLDEIAALIGTSRRTVSKRLARAQETLRKIVAEEGEGGEGSPPRLSSRGEPS